MNGYSTASTLYVSALIGNDRNTGLSPENDGVGGGPVKTVGHALSLVGQLRHDGILQPYTIKLLDDTYALSEPVYVRPNTKSIYAEKTPSHVTVEPYGEGRVTLLGGEEITGFVPAVFNGVSCLAAQVPEAKNGWRFTDLYVNGKRAKTTRYPESGFFTPVEVENNGIDLRDSSSWFIAKEGDLPKGTDLSDAVLSFEHYWIDEHTAIADYDEKTGKVTLAAATRFTVSPDAWPSSRMDYYLENLPFAFKNPGEFYLDGKEGMLYYIPRDDSETKDTVTVLAPRLSHLLCIEGTPDDPAEGVTFRRIRFACTKGEYESYGCPKSHGKTTKDAHAYDPQRAYASDLQACSDMHGAIMMRYAKYCTLEECEITCVGNHGVYMDEGCTDDRILNCHIHELGAGGIRVSGGQVGDEAHTLTHHVTVENCHIENGGLRYFAACGIALIHASHSEVSHCTIHDFFYSGISAGFVWGYTDSNTHHNRFLYNHIYNLGKGVLSDMGGIYLLAPQAGTLVKGNLIHDVKCKVYGGWALYTDEGSSFITVEDNVCYRTSSNCYHQHYGASNVLRNNVFAMSEAPLLAQSRRESRLGLILENNVFYSLGTAAMMGCTPANISSRRNLFFNAKAQDCPLLDFEGTVYSFEEGKARLGTEDGSLVADPLFRDPENGDFTLCEGSPALRIGFRPIDMSNVGCHLE